MNGPLSVWRDWRERRKILSELRGLRADEREILRFKITDDLNEALAWLASSDHGKATEIWTSLIDRHPGETRASPVAPQVLVKLGRFDEAESLMQEGRRKHPHDGFFATKLAEITQAKGDYEEAIQRCAALRKQFPNVIHGYFLGALSLTALNRLEEAEKLAEQTMSRFPQDIRGFLEYARIADRRNDWAEALRRWLVVRDKFTGHPFGYMGCGRAMIRLERFDEADAILTDGRTRFPTGSELVTELARCAEAKGDVPEALERWRRRVDRFPLELHGCCDAAAAFERLGRPAEADATFRAAIERFPGEQRPKLELANLLNRIGDRP